MRIRLVCDDGPKHKIPLIISVDDDGTAQIRFERAPVSDRDRSVAVVCGDELATVALLLRVEALP